MKYKVPDDGANKVPDDGAFIIWSVSLFALTWLQAFVCCERFTSNAI